MLQSEKGSKIIFLDPFGNQQFHPWNQDRFELVYIQYSVQKGNVTKLFKLAGFLEENTAELIAVGNHHYMMGKTTDKRKFVIQVLSEEIRINHLVVNKTNHQNVFFLPIQPRYKFAANGFIEIEVKQQSAGVSDQGTKTEELPSQIEVNPEMGQSDEGLLEPKPDSKTLMDTNMEANSNDSGAQPTSSNKTKLNSTPS